MVNQYLTALLVVGCCWSCVGFTPPQPRPVHHSPRLGDQLLNSSPRRRRVTVRFQLELAAKDPGDLKSPMKRRRRRQIIAEYFREAIGRRKRSRREIPGEDSERTEVPRGQDTREEVAAQWRSAVVSAKAVDPDTETSEVDLSEVIEFLAEQRGGGHLSVASEGEGAREQVTGGSSEETEEDDKVDPERRHESNLIDRSEVEPLADQIDYDHLSGDLEGEGDEEETLDERESVRSATARNGVDLTGTWTPVVTEVFKSQYDAYLKNCSETYFFRQVVVNGIGYQEETIRQLDGGKSLEITATNPVGDWNRTLVASPEDAPLQVAIIDPDKDECLVEAYWIDSGTRHKSLLKGKPRVKGGVFETIRYLDGGDNLVCESYFHPSPNAPAKFKPAHVVWNFTRVA